MNFLSYDNLFGRFLYLVGDIVTLHVLWVVCSLPIVTIGASTTALYYSCMKRIRTDEGTISRNFFHAFRQNFRQSTLLWLLMLVLVFVMVLDLRIGLAVEGWLGKVMLVSCSVFLVPCFFISLYIFPVQAKFDNPIRYNLKNAFLMSWHSFGYTLLLVVIAGTFFVMTLCFQPFMGLMIICGAGFYGYITSAVYVQVFRRYLPDEMKQDYEAAGLQNLKD